MEGNAITQSDVRRVFGDPARSRELHDRRMECFNVEIRQNSALRNRSLVVSSLVGLTSSAGVLGALCNTSLVEHGEAARSITLLVNATIGGIAIAYAVFRTLIFERVVYDIELKRELWEIDNHLGGEIQEMVAIYKAQGLSEDDATTITRIFAKHKSAFANLMREAIVDAAIPGTIGYTLGWMLPLFPLTIKCISVGQRELLSRCVLVIGTAAVSVAQSVVFYGSYLSVQRVAISMVWDLSATAILFGVARTAMGLLRG
uniref:VIT family protein n=1 Tax=Trypanosoma vivax (strain Y486) TaxID=1055687 RepID=G0TTE2_TRYVY|nr:conserved hypothetical protein, fragment [Trypanosoma vivax Y486]